MYKFKDYYEMNYDVCSKTPYWFLSCIAVQKPYIHAGLS